ncbi:TonB-dependent receptor [Novosphingobium sp. YJ-S2-02]|uniref:TonB-dependent receptor n=1 Tax=Novosphingobium aureum TaxID=2792964 RepID=A0A931HEI8_9SPHN|nr:TonB-dependent receptor [Novosphingobium aureum]MBH0114541.1 TonB-dependent receptor [Novosphingobium aureum]
MKISQRSLGRRALALLSTTTILAGMSLGAASAVAQDSAVTGQDEFGDIVVTATRTSESIQKVPISIQALGAAKLEERQITGLSDFANLMPSVTIAGLGPGRQTPYFRGIVPAGGSYASVGYYLDDIPIAGTGVPDIHVYDVERIEALSGPQGTLYGAGSLAGTVRFITNKPKLDTFEYGYSVEGNKYGAGDMGGQLESYVNAPLTNTLAIRAMGYYRRDGGYIDNTPNNGTFNDGRTSSLTLGDDNPDTYYVLDNSDIAEDDYNKVREYGGRLSLLWEPAPGWEARPEITAQHQKAYGYFGYDPRVGDLEVHDYDLTLQDDKWYQAQLSIHGHIGDWDLVSATGYYKRKVHLRNDYTYYTVTYDGFGAGYESYLQFFDNCSGSGADQQCELISPQQYYNGLTKDKQYTQELRITTPSSWPFDVTFGGFYQHRKQETNSDYAIHGLDTITGYTQTGGGDVAGGLIGVPAMYGIGYDDMGTPFFDTSDVVNPDGNPLGTMVYGSPAVKRDAYYLSERNNTWNDKAIFAEGHYDITPTLKVTGGIRFFWTDFSTKGFSGIWASAQNTVTSLYVPTGTYGCPVPLPDERMQCLNSNLAAADQVGRYKESGETHKIALDWQFSPTKMVYFNYSTGFRPGGFNRPLRVRNVGVVSVPSYDSETLTNFEVGVKTRWAGIFRFNAAVYLENWDNIQYSVVVSGTQGAGMTGNAGKAQVKGFEYDADLKLGDVTISTSGAFNDAKLKGNFCNFALDTSSMSISQLGSCAAGEYVPDSYPPTPQVAAANGTRLPRQPKFKGTTSVRYDTRIGEMDAYVMGAALYQTSATQDLNVSDNNLYVCPEMADTMTTACTTSGFVTFDFSAGIKKDNWTLDLFMQNAFDNRGTLTMNTFCSITFCSGSSRTFPVKPQYFGMKFGQKF